LGIGEVISILVFVGFVLFMAAMNGLSKDYGEPKIFNYLLHGLILNIILAIIVGVIWFALFMVNMLSGFSNLNLASSLSTVQIQSIITPYYAPLIIAMTLVSLIWIIYNYKAFNLLSKKSGVNQFSIAAKIFVAGALTNVAVGIIFSILSFLNLIGFTTMLLVSVPGGLIQYVGWVYAAKGFFAIPITQQTFMPQPFPCTPAEGLQCPNCGTKNPADSSFCTRCGQKL
jgi:uncharacterized membrane protein